MLSKNIDRIAAEEDIRMVMALCAATSEKGFDKFLEDRRRVMGKVAVFDEAKIRIIEAEQERDREGLMALKKMGRMI